MARRSAGSCDTGVSCRWSLHHLQAPRTFDRTSARCGCVCIGRTWSIVVDLPRQPGSLSQHSGSSCRTWRDSRAHASVFLMVAMLCGSLTIRPPVLWAVRCMWAGLWALRGAQRPWPHLDGVGVAGRDTFGAVGQPTTRAGRGGEQEAGGRVSLSPRHGV